MRKITLEELLQYFKDDGGDIQITFEDREWDEYDQVGMESRLLKPYMKRKILCMGFESANDNESDILRVTLSMEDEE